MLLYVLLTILILYVAASIIVYFLANSNIIPSRRNKEYTIKFSAKKKYITSYLNPDKQLAYWEATQDASTKNVILLHGFTRTSDKMQTRAEVYWELGYNLYFVDNLGHGYSSDQLYPSGYRYSREVKNFIQELNIQSPIIHGLSMGAIAANVIGQLEPELAKALVCEALPINFDNLYSELLRYLGIPPVLFPWLEWLSRKLNWKQFDKLGISEEQYEPWTVKLPMFLVHSKSDTLFKYSEHFLQLRELLADRQNVWFWAVEDAGHTRMANDTSYDQKLSSYIKYIDNMEAVSRVQKELGVA